MPGMYNFNNIRNNIHIYICKQSGKYRKGRNHKMAAPITSGSLEKQEFGKLSQKSKTHFLIGPPPEEEDLIIIKEEQISLVNDDNNNNNNNVNNNNVDCRGEVETEIMNNVKQNLKISSLPKLTKSNNNNVNNNSSHSATSNLPKLMKTNNNNNNNSIDNKLYKEKQKKKKKKKSDQKKRKKKKIMSLDEMARIRETDKFVAAASEGRLEEVVYRIRHGQEVDAKDSDRKFTAMLYAAKFGRNKCLRVLLEYGAEVNQRHIDSQKTAIHFASESGRANEVQVLLDAGADKTMEDKDGNTPLSLCEEYHFEEVRAKLRDPPLIMETPLALEFSTTHVSFKWTEPVSLGADIDEYRIVWKLESGGPWMESTKPNKLDLQWDEEGFGYGDPISEISPKLRNYTLSNLAPACTITLAMRAHNMAGFGPLSKQLVMKTSPDIPGVPTNLQYVNKTATSINYTFDFPLDYGDPIDYYQFFYRVHHPDPTDAVAVEIFNAALEDGRVVPDVWVPYPRRITSSNAAIVNLEPGTTYDFKLRAHNGIGYSDFSEITETRRTDDAPYLVRKTKFSITVAWTAQTGALKYEMQYQENKMAHMWATVSSAIRGAECTCENLFPAREYRFRIRAFQEQGWASYEGSALSQWIETKHDITDPPGIPTLKSVGIWNIEVEWPPPEILNGEPVDRYEVQMMQMTIDPFDTTETRTLEEIQVWQSLSMQCIGEAWNAINLAPGISYRFRVRAHNLIGWSLFGEVSENFTTRPKEPDQMEPPSVIALSPYSIKLNWVTPIENGRPVTNYQVEQWQLSVDQNDTVDTIDGVKGWNTVEAVFNEVGNALTYTIPAIDIPHYPFYRKTKGLKPGLMYKYRVKAMNAVGWSPWSDESAPVETYPAKPFVPPKIPWLASDTTTSSILVKWTKPLTLGAPIDAYEIQQMQLSIDPNDHSRELKDVKFWKSFEYIYREGNIFSGKLDEPKLHFQACDLEPGIKYKYRIRCRNFVDWSPFTGDSDIFTTKPIEPNQPKRPLTVDRFTTSSSVGVKWEAPMTNGAPIIEYQVDMKQLSVDLSYTAVGGYKSIGGNFGSEDAPITKKKRPWVTVSCADILDFCQDGLEPGIKFHFRVRCRNSVGWSLWSEISDVIRTLPTIPDKVEGVEFTTIKAREVAIKWTLPLCRGVIIDSYEVQYQGKSWKEVENVIEIVKENEGGKEDELKEENVDDNERIPEAEKEMKLVPDEWETIKVVVAPLMRFTLAKLLPWTEHRFRIRAHAHGWSEYSQPTQWGRTLATKPPPPNAPTLVVRTHSLLSVKWEHYHGPMDSSISNGSSLIAYELQYRVGRDPTWIPLMEDMLMSHEQWGCASVVPHYFRVRALNSEGWSEYSPESEEMRPRRSV